MGNTPSNEYRGTSRRAFLLGTGCGLLAGGAAVVGAPSAWQWIKGRLGGEQSLPLAGQNLKESARLQYAMPGPFPGRVVEIRHRGSVSADNQVRPEAVRQMMARGMTELTGADDSREAWRHFFATGDVVGIKVNPVGRKSRSDAAGAISHPEILIEIVENLKAAGVRPRDIVVFERYANEFREAGYEAVLGERALDGVRWYASGTGYDPSQLDIEGYDSRVRRKERDPHVVGYDPDVFVHMGFCDPNSEKDERRYRSHLSLIVTRMVDKIITIPVLKDHRSAGVTLALKNLSHGMNNNVARSHIGKIARRDGSSSAPNQCNTFIPTAASQSAIREKATLHILDGLVGVYEGGPGCWNPTWATWRKQALFFATDPVALDHVGWDIIDAKRAREGWQPVAQMGNLQVDPAPVVFRRLAALAGTNASETIASAATALHFPGSQETEQFDRRQPEHIILAGTIGLGVFDARQIEHRVVALS